MINKYFAIGIGLITVLKIVAIFLEPSKQELISLAEHYQAGRYIGSCQARQQSVLDDERTNTTRNSSITSANIYLNGFTINQEGIIEIPYIGDVHVLNQTIDQAKKSIEEKVDEYLKEATVIVKLGNFNVTVLGEIYRPNTYPVYQDNITIFEAIALSGGITDYGDLTKVKLIRNYNKR